MPTMFPVIDDDLEFTIATFEPGDNCFAATGPGGLIIAHKKNLLLPALARGYTDRGKATVSNHLSSHAAGQPRVTFLARAQEDPEKFTTAVFDTTDPDWEWNKCVSANTHGILTGLGLICEKTLLNINDSSMPSYREWLLDRLIITDPWWEWD